MEREDGRGDNARRLLHQNVQSFRAFLQHTVSQLLVMEAGFNVVLPGDLAYDIECTSFRNTYDSIVAVGNSYFRRLPPGQLRPDQQLVREVAPAIDVKNEGISVAVNSAADSTVGTSPPYLPSPAPSPGQFGHDGNVAEGLDSDILNEDNHNQNDPTINAAERLMINEPSNPQDGPSHEETILNEEDFSELSPPPTMRIPEMNDDYLDRAPGSNSSGSTIPIGDLFSFRDIDDEIELDQEDVTASVAAEIPAQSEVRSSEQEIAENEPPPPVQPTTEIEEAEASSVPISEAVRVEPPEAQTVASSEEDAAVKIEAVSLAGAQPIPITGEKVGGSERAGAYYETISSEDEDSLYLFMPKTPGLLVDQESEDHDFDNISESEPTVPTEAVTVSDPAAPPETVNDRNVSKKHGAVEPKDQSDAVSAAAPVLRKCTVRLERLITSDSNREEGQREYENSMYPTTEAVEIETEGHSTEEAVPGTSKDLRIANSRNSTPTIHIYDYLDNLESRLKATLDEFARFQRGELNEQAFKAAERKLERERRRREIAQKESERREKSRTKSAPSGSDLSSGSEADESEVDEDGNSKEKQHVSVIKKVASGGIDGQGEKKQNINARRSRNVIEFIRNLSTVQSEDGERLDDMSDTTEENERLPDTEQPVPVVSENAASTNGVLEGRSASDQVLETIDVIPPSDSESEKDLSAASSDEEGEVRTEPNSDDPIPPKRQKTEETKKRRKIRRKRRSGNSDDLAFRNEEKKMKAMMAEIVDDASSSSNSSTSTDLVQKTQDFVRTVNGSDSPKSVVVLDSDDWDQPMPIVETPIRKKLSRRSKKVPSSKVPMVKRTAPDKITEITLDGSDEDGAANRDCGDEIEFLENVPAGSSKRSQKRTIIEVPLDSPSSVSTCLPSESSGRESDGDRSPRVKRRKRSSDPGSLTPARPSQPMGNRALEFEAGVNAMEAEGVKTPPLRFPATTLPPHLKDDPPSQSDGESQRSSSSVVVASVAVPTRRKAIRPINERVPLEAKKEALRCKAVEAESQKLEAVNKRGTGKRLQLSVGDSPLIEVDDSIACELKEHQRKGIEFLWTRCILSVEKALEPGNGAILSHCMGLGKTLQILAFLHTLLTYPVLGIKHCLVLCPKNVTSNWRAEFRCWLSSVKVKVLLYNIVGKRKVKLDLLKNFEATGGICVIHYDGFRVLVEGHEDRKKKKGQKKGPLVPNVETIPGGEGPPDPGNAAEGSSSTLQAEIEELKTVARRVLFNTQILVCDEGHTLKSGEALLPKLIRRIGTKRKIILTGTPMQNNLEEYYYMIDLVQPGVLGKLSHFSNSFINPIKNGQHNDSNEDDIKIAKRREYLLSERTKGFVHRCFHTVLQKFIPPKFEFAIFLNLSPLQKDLYVKYLETIREDIMRARENTTDPDAAENKCLRLFKHYALIQGFCCHPMLLYKKPALPPNNNRRKRRRKLAAKEAEVEEGAISVPLVGSEAHWIQGLIPMEKRDEISADYTIATKMVALKEIVQATIDWGEKILIFSRYIAPLSIIQEYIERDAFGWGPLALEKDYFRIDGTTPAEDRHKFCCEFNRSESAKLFLITTKAGGLGVNLHAANRVVMMDVSMNPSDDEQSIFRIYRLGQTRTCYVYRLICRGGMEEKTYNRGLLKLAIGGRIVDQQQSVRNVKLDNTINMYEFNPDSVPVGAVDPKKPVEDHVLKNLLENSSVVASYVEHQTLLQDNLDEHLNEEQKQEAWKEGDAPVLEQKKPRGRAKGSKAKSKGQAKDPDQGTSGNQASPRQRRKTRQTEASTEAGGSAHAPAQDISDPFAFPLDMTLPGGSHGPRPQSLPEQIPETNFSAALNDHTYGQPPSPFTFVEEEVRPSVPYGNARNHRSVDTAPPPPPVVVPYPPFNPADRYHCLRTGEALPTLPHSAACSEMIQIIESFEEILKE